MELLSRLVSRGVANVLAMLTIACVLAGMPGGATGAADSQPQGIAVVALQALPPEVRHTLELIRKGGPYPFDRDGVVFGNRERFLPLRARSYYREYTVATPGLPHRGPRRIVEGRGGELYYTEDHYRTFRRISE